MIYCKRTSSLRPIIYVSAAFIQRLLSIEVLYKFVFHFTLENRTRCQRRLFLIGSRCPTATARSTDHVSTLICTTRHSSRRAMTQYHKRLSITIFLHKGTSVNRAQTQTSTETFSVHETELLRKCPPKGKAIRALTSRRLIGTS
jgi:hypothetical protein